MFGFFRIKWRRQKDVVSHLLLLLLLLHLHEPSDALLLRQRPTEPHFLLLTRFRRVRYRCHAIVAARLAAAIVSLRSGLRSGGSRGGCAATTTAAAAAAAGCCCFLSALARAFLHRPAAPGGYVRALWLLSTRLLQLQPHHVIRAPRSRLRTAREAIEASCASTPHIS